MLHLVESYFRRYFRVRIEVASIRWSSCSMPLTTTTATNKNETMSEVIGDGQCMDGGKKRESRERDSSFGALWREVQLVGGIFLESLFPPTRPIIIRNRSYLSYSQLMSTL